ncbi:MAG: hypothetical protein A2937_03540 [Candidatus Yonathbacteria bacterium RIFCSPLOWO2_01_FULL_47_33b]|uniref:PEP-CTERM protein-sorting domain-containing protein n=1 Tax=Candidatus Yonathbacteria bacterium RIFCSPLOWO2_01_FULL_47_33b TaxID=1802727 RepID=A0A1G2SFA6_9BACT|nr:MAG: hypothetical protein A2937_03540 [Candidatus Yonathbacteria bacterium RIFCSPLOWO2_01_FULL_47_33b]
MKRLVAVLLSVVAVVSVGSARAALVYDGYATGPGGLSTPYPAANPEVYAGLLEANLGTPTLVMSADYNARVAVGDVQTLHIYTYADVMAGAPVRFTPAQYARAGYMLHGYFPMEQFPNSAIQTYASFYGSNALAALNTQVWDIMSSNICLAFLGDCSTANTFIWSASMLIAEGVDTYLIPINTSQTTLVGTTQTTMTSTPVPPAFWLLGSGLLGLVGVARKRSRLH